MKHAVPVALAASLAASACYQSLGAAYSYRFAESGGHSVEGRYAIVFDDVIGDDAPAAFAGVAIGGGTWGARGADTIGVMAQESFGDAAFFLRPALAYLVIGAEALAGDDRLWFGLGAELDLGFLIPTGDDGAFEIGVHTGADLGYTGTGTGGFVGVFLGYGWAVEPDFYTR